MSNILIVDDDKMICDALVKIIRSMGHDVRWAHTLKEGLMESCSNMYDVVFLDVCMPDGNGLEALPRFQKVVSSPEIIIITGASDPDGAELAIKSGAWNYIQKPFSNKMPAFALQLSRALQYREEKMSRKPLVALMRDGIVGDSPQLKTCLDLLAQAANSDASVLITGETGTGKELFAQAIHNNSSRVGQNFIVVDCAALPKTLVESMLFGHEKGAFTGADRPMEGLIKQAHGGTLFLDEVGELPLSLQKAFLRVLQEHRFRPIGGKKEVVSNFRLVSATNRNLEQMVQLGQFRNDLKYRLRTFTIDLPPLREHFEDIKEIVMYHTTNLCKRHGISRKKFSCEFFDTLFAYDWPGNVRELVNTLEMVLISARDETTIFPKHLPMHIRVKVARASVTKGDLLEGTHCFIADSQRKLPNLRNYLEECKQQYFTELMALAKNDIKKACQISGTSRSSLYEHLKKHNIPYS